VEILRAIERADALCPNPYTLEEKISWCDEVTASLRRNIIKIYGVIETEVDGCGELVLPDDIPFERVELVYVGNQLFNKYDFRSFADNFCAPRETGIKQKFRVVYLVLPKPVRNPEIVGEFNTGTDTIEITESPFITGDTIEITTLSNIQEAPDWKKAEAVHVMEVGDDKIILDPGVGFAKNYEQNLEVIARVGELKALGYPVLLGTSRKSVIGLTLDLPVEERLEGTLVTTVMAVEQGCTFVRVHDVQENARAIRMAERILKHG